MGRVPRCAYDDWVALGPGRSFAQLAARYGVTDRALRKRAENEGWRERLAIAERAAHAAANVQSADSLQEVQSRHLKMAKLLQAKAIEALRSTHLGAGASAIRALDTSVKLERLLLGQTGADEPTDDTYVMRLTQPDIDELLALGKECRERREANLRAEIERSVRAQIAKEQAAAARSPSAELPQVPADN